MAPTPEEAIPAPDNAGNPAGGWEPGVSLKTSTSDQFRQTNYSCFCVVCELRTFLYVFKGLETKQNKTSKQVHVCPPKPNIATPPPLMRMFAMVSTAGYDSGQFQLRGPDRSCSVSPDKSAHTGASLTHPKKCLTPLSSAYNRGQGDIWASWPPSL